MTINANATIVADKTRGGREPFLTVRDQFAMAALSGLLNKPLPGDTAMKMAQAAFVLADAMMKARDQ